MSASFVAWIKAVDSGKVEKPSSFYDDIAQGLLDADVHEPADVAGLQAQARNTANCHAALRFAA